jgi:hypothetical protein
VLIASNLTWLFDGFEIYALFLSVGFALHQLLEAGEYSEIPRYAGYLLATTAFGWATAGKPRANSVASLRRCAGVGLHSATTALHSFPSRSPTCFLTAAPAGGSSAHF